MAWLERLTSLLTSRRQPSGVIVRNLSPAEISEQEHRRRAEIDEARAEAFAGVPPVPLELVAPLDLDGGVAYAGVDYLDRLVLATSPVVPTEAWAGRDVSAAGASFPNSKSAAVYPLCVRTISPDGTTTETSLPAVPVAFPNLQPMPDGNWLVVGARSRLTDSGAEHNAHLFSAAGEPLSSFCIGDGVESVQVTPSGKIWASYFDEGVYGNYGWGAPHGPDPLGRSGLVLWSLSGERCLELVAPDGCGPVDDCYALNVIGEDAWVCYYSDFPLVHTRPDGSAVGWLTDVSGPHALAVHSEITVGLVGGYEGLFDRLVLVDISADDAAPTTATYKLSMPDLSDLPADTRVLARGRYIIAIAGDQWLRLDLGQLANSTR